MPTWTHSNTAIDEYTERSDFQISIDTEAITTDWGSSSLEVDAETIIDELTSSGPTLKQYVKELMEHNSLDGWFFDHATDETSIEQLAERMPEYGQAAAESLVLESAKREFESAISGVVSEDDHVVAFNEVTSDWPHLPRPVFAAYLVQSDDDYPDEFEQQARDFAEGEDVMNREIQTTLDVYYDENPYQDDGLTTIEAELIVTARLLGFDDSEVPLDDITDYENFIWWLEEGEDMEKAERLHQFGRDLPEEVLEYAAPREEWEIPTDSLRRRNCVECGTEHTRIHHHEEGVSYVTTDGHVAPVGDINESDQFFYDNQGGTPGNINLVCEHCWPDFEGNHHRATVVTHDGPVKVRAMGGFIEDMGANDPELVSFGSLSEEEQNTVMLIARFNVRAQDWHILTTGAGPVSESAAQERIETAIDIPTELGALEDSDGMVGIVSESRFDGRRRMVMGRRDDWPACRYAKELLDGTREVSA